MLWSCGPLGALSLLASDLAAPAAWPAAALALFAAARAAIAEAARPPRRLEWPGHGAPRLDGVPLARACVQWRGPLAFLHWREGRRRRALSWWPDTLPPAARRGLKLASHAWRAAPDGPSVAP